MSEAPWRSLGASDAQFQAWVDQIKAEIIADAKVGAVSAWTSTYGELGDYVDQNTYGLRGEQFAIEPEGVDVQWDDLLATYAAAQELVNRWLSDGGLLRATGRTPKGGIVVGFAPRLDAVTMTDVGAQSAAYAVLEARKAIAADLVGEAVQLALFLPTPRESRPAPVRVDDPQEAPAWRVAGLTRQGPRPEVVLKVMPSWNGSRRAALLEFVRLHPGVTPLVSMATSGEVVPVVGLGSRLRGA